MSQVIPYPAARSPDEATARIGMALFLGSWTMLFAALFFAYGMIRERAEAWPPPGTPPLPLAPPALATAAIAASSAFLHRAVVSARRGTLGAVFPSVAACFAFGAAFLLLQGVLWARLWSAGIRPDTGPHASVLWGLTVFHALHAAVGLGALATLAARALRGAFRPGRALPLRLWATYWHFVGAIWLVTWLTVFIL
jgi:heme/copper-type cytochrome/quinol oxidase subunit 3